MRFRNRSLLAPMLSLLMTLTLPACFGGGDEASEEVAAEDGEEAPTDGEEVASADGENAEATGEETANSAETADGSDGAADENTENIGEDAVASSNNATENDLQEIIGEMNGQNTASGEATPALAQEAMPAAETPTETAPVAQAMPSNGGFAQPGGSPAGQGLPEMGSKMAYVVQPGDTLAKISQKVYGDLNRWKEMAELTGMAKPSRIFPGDVVYYTLDETSTAFATAYESVQRSEETVQPGDTLATIARRVYGSSHAWKTIWRQNDNIDNPDVVKPGSTVYFISKQALSAALKNVKAELAKVNQISKQVAKTWASSLQLNDSFGSINGYTVAIN